MGDLSLSKISALTALAMQNRLRNTPIPGTIPGPSAIMGEIGRKGRNHGLDGTANPAVFSSSLERFPRKRIDPIPFSRSRLILGESPANQAFQVPLPY